MREKLSPEKSGWGWKLLVVAIILGFLFMLFFYLAVNNDPDYMPSHQQKQIQQHAEAPAMASSTSQNVAHESHQQDQMQINMDMGQHQHTNSTAH